MKSLVPVLFGFALTAHAKFAMPELIPADRLVKNAETYVAAHPTDAFARYTLGRIHYLAFVLKIGMVPAHADEPDGLPRPARDQLIGQPLAAVRRQRAEELARDELGIKESAPTGAAVPAYLRAVSQHLKKLEADAWRPPEASGAVLLNHAVAAAEAFRKAIALDPKNALYPLGLGSLLDQFAEWNDDEKIEALPSPLAGDLRAMARRHYFAAWAQAFPEESKTKSLPVGGLSELVSFEAGRGFLRLADEQPASVPEPEKSAIPRVKAAVAKLEKLPRGAITPLVLSLKPTRHLDDLLAPQTVVHFDLRGYGAHEQWPWLKPDAGLLVWDPGDRRAITSGRQLFGSYTFQIFWRNGYDVLRLLDDDGDGQLSAAELEGISVWFDRNGDARSQSDEVASATSLGIRALSVSATAADERHPMNPSGVTFSDGRVLPTWDWIAEPVAP